MRYVAFLPWLLALACGSAPRSPWTPQPRLAGAAPAYVDSPTCAPEPTAIGRIQDSDLDEISGLVASRRVPGVLFVHNDSGDSPRIFAVNERGELLAELELASVPVLIDAEDIAIGPAPGGRWFLYLGDTGNNFASMGLGIPRRKAVLYRIEEPAISLDARNQKLSIAEAAPITFTFPDGARDVEAFFVDPLSGDLFMIGKQANGHSHILSASAEQLAAGGGKLRLELELVFGKQELAGSPMPTAASISRDGLSILIRTYSSAFLFRRKPGESVSAALQRPPAALPVAREQQGEAIG